MYRKITFFMCGCVLLFGETRPVNAFFPSDFRRMFSGYCQPLTNCRLREKDCPYGGYAKDLLGCSVCMCAISPTACEGVQCPYGEHCETLSRRAGWFSLRNYRCVSDSVKDELSKVPIFPVPVQPPAALISPVTTSTKHPVETTPAKTTTTTTTIATTTKPAAPEMTTNKALVEKTNRPSICPGGGKPGVLCNKDRHCKSDQTCRIYPNLEYGVCCDNVKIRPQESIEYRFIPRCKQTQDIGPCRSLIPRYFYNATSGRCERFIFGGCGNNDNNFRSYDECKMHCENPCRLPSYAGRCRAAMARVYYDYETNRCDTFYFGGCPNEANGNNWDSFEDCYSHCYDRTRK